jgi:hypothetical protein
MATLKRLDWLGLLVPVSFRDAGVIERDRLEVTRLDRRMQSRRETGGPVREGFDAVAQVAWRVPLLWPVAPLLALSRWLGIGQRVYDFVAARRHGHGPGGRPKGRGAWGSRRLGVAAPGGRAGGRRR